MTKSAKAKKEQDYTPKLIPQTCGVCQHCAPVMGQVLRYIDPDSYLSGTHMVSEPVSQKCGIGGFAVKKMGSCGLWLPVKQVAK